MTNDRFDFACQVEVRFRDCDPMGHVNHAVYFSYLEQCRFGFWRRLTGRSFGPEAGIILARAECDYRAPAEPGEILDVGLNVGRIGRSSFTLTYAIVNARAALVAEGQTVQVAYDYGVGRSIALSRDLIDLLEAARKSPA